MTQRTLKTSINVIGEGITEKYYIESLKGLSSFSVTPRSLDTKASNLKELEKYIKQSFIDNYDKVYCLIDMDGKSSGRSATDYHKLKDKYHNKTFTKRGLSTEVIFFESERCIEIWFLFHFLENPISKNFTSYKELELELKRFMPKYEKTKKFYINIKSIHDYITSKPSPTGDLKKAIRNAKASVDSRNEDERKYTYTEIYLLIEKLGIKI